MDEEEWRLISGTTNYYISNHGRVANGKTDKILKTRKSGWGYEQITIYENQKFQSLTIHRLVAEHFVPGEDVGLEVNHIDGNKQNNDNSNLEWVTKRENNQHAIDTGLRLPRGRGVVCNETGEIFKNLNKAAEAFNTTPQAIRYSLSHGRPNRQGYSFRDSS